MDKVRIKLNPVADVVKGKRVILIDDSIVRGTTCARIVKLLRDAGATEVHMRIASPPFVNPCYYGTDIDSKEHLIACRYSIDEIAKVVGADTLGYLSLDSIKCIAGCEAKNNYCTACFDGIYPTDVPTNNQKDKFQSKISENAKK
jgi:amidophosphoribosyltransferase